VVSGQNARVIWNLAKLALEYALYMIHQLREAAREDSGKPCEIGSSWAKSLTIQNLDDLKLPPYTSAVPGNGRDFEPPWRRSVAR
jgi:hypothetical protein